MYFSHFILIIYCMKKNQISFHFIFIFQYRKATDMIKKNIKFITTGQFVTFTIPAKVFPLMYVSET